MFFKAKAEKDNFAFALASMTLTFRMSISCVKIYTDIKKIKRFLRSPKLKCQS